MIMLLCDIYDIFSRQNIKYFVHFFYLHGASKEEQKVTP